MPSAKEDILSARLEERLSFEELIANLSAKFVNVPSDRVDREINEAQRQVCEHLGLDLSALWQVDPSDPTNLILTHLHRPLGGPPLPSHMVATEYFPWCLQEMAAGKVVVVPSSENVPPEAARDQEMWRRF